MKNLFESKYRDHIIGLLLWLGIFTAYLQTIASTVEFIDSGELATVPYVLGIAHPTGYPLWTLIAHIFSSLPIAKEEIMRLNIFSAFITACAAVIFYYAMLFLLRVESDEDAPLLIFIPAVFSALTLAFSQTFWDQSTSIEVYALHVFLLCSTILFFAKAVFLYINTQVLDQRLWWLFAFTLGLSFTNHLTTILLAPAFLYLYFSAFGFSKGAFRQILILAFPFALGLSVYLYFPIRAVQHPVLNWGYPATLERIFWHISGKQYRIWMFSSSDVTAKQWKHFVEALPMEFYYAPLLLSALGIWRLIVHNRRLFAFILLLFAGCILYTINYDIKDIDSYFLLAYISIAMLAGFGIVEAGSLFKTLWGSIAVIAFLAAVLIAEISVNWSEVDASDNHLVEDYTANILTNLEPNAIIISYQWDYFIAASYYFQYVRHVRDDVIVIDKELLRRSWYFMQMEKNHPAIYKKSKRDIESFLEELDKFEHDKPYDPAVIEAKYNQMIDGFIDHNVDSVAIYVTAEIEPHLASHYLRVPEGFAFRLYRDSTYHPVRFPTISYHPYHKANIYTQQIHHMYTSMLVQRAVYEEGQGKMDFAQRYARKAYEINPNGATAQFLQRLTGSPQYSRGR
jgi:hypothetical protein